MGIANAGPGENFSFPEIDQHAFFGLLASSLPDDFGNRLIDAWLRRNGRSPNSFNPVERLCYIGEVHAKRRESIADFVLIFYEKPQPKAITNSWQTSISSARIDDNILRQVFRGLVEQR